MRESRLSEAAQLLQSSDLNVSDIGERCGFESLYAFSRAFRKAYGIPPRTYRQLVQEGGPLPVSGQARVSWDRVRILFHFLTLFLFLPRT